MILSINFTDSNKYFEECLEENATELENGEYLKRLYEQSVKALRVVEKNAASIEKIKSTNEINEESDDDSNEQDENTSYLDMSMQKYECYDLNATRMNSNPHEYVDIAGKSTTECKDDDNIYDNYIVENSKTAAVQVHSEKRDCPFGGLPAAHLMIMQSPKVGWLIMHQRRRSGFMHNFSVSFRKKYYAGLVVENHNNRSDNKFCYWWFLLYAGGSSELKPTVCLPLYQFEITCDPTNKSKNNRNSKKETNSKTAAPEKDENQCKFELRAKSTRKDSKSYCLTAESPDHCNEWFNLLKQLIDGKPYVETSNVVTAQIRKLPKLPMKAKSAGLDEDDSNDNDTVDMPANGCKLQNKVDEKEIINYSEGIYEEPEEYYRNVTAKGASKTMKTLNETKSLMKKTTRTTTTTDSQSPSSNASTIQIEDISLIYDIPKPNSRNTMADTQKEHIFRDENGRKTIDTDASESVLESNRIQIDDAVRSKLTFQLKDQSEKFLNNLTTITTTPKNDHEKIVRNSVANKKHQLSNVRKWLFSNHLAKMRHSTNSTGSRKSTENMKNDSLRTSSKQSHKLNAIAPMLSETQQKRQIFSVQPKGNKVHMIINQLEANGQLTLLSGGASSSKQNIAT